MERIIILAGVVIQSMISKSSKVAGAITGFVITSFLFLWGLLAYGSGDAMVFSGIELSQGMFIMFCLGWYAVDTGTLVSAIRERRTAAASVPESQAFQAEEPKDDIDITLY
jgi:hypothetical protein